VGVSQVHQKYPCAVEHINPVCMGITAPTSSQVATESGESLHVHVRNGQAMPTGPVDELFRRPKMSPTGNHRVSHVRQGLRKALKHSAGLAISKRANSPTVVAWNFAVWLEIQRRVVA